MGANIVLPDWVVVFGDLIVVVRTNWGSRSSIVDGASSGLASLGVLLYLGEEVTDLQFPEGVGSHAEAITIVESGPLECLTVGSEGDWLEGEVVGGSVGFHQFMSESHHGLSEDLKGVDL